MFEIIQSLNNSCALVKDENSNKKIILYKGIGFGVKQGDIIPDNDQYQVFSLKNEDPSKLNEIIKYTDPLYIEIAGEILAVAKKHLPEVDDKILLALADHIEFAVYRIKNNIAISNPFAQDITILFDQQYQIALLAKQIIAKKCNVEINAEEIAFITLHIQTATTKSATVANFIELTRIVNKYLNIMEKDFNIKIDNNTVFYNRFLSHIKYMLVRIERNEQLSLDISDVIKDKYQYSYNLATAVCNEISETFQNKLSQVEVGYLALHIERIKDDELNKTK